ncbi:Transcriptional regulator of acetoin/glycerol metabolism [Pseudonocardia thermophila]|uniref:Transcriptional regulator of acetoin/glycerol metabolism n=1 Tax=Pseudonocardia thermophila TaxID=1848 RepID=A0A1M6PIW6_PSETH|nr:helix-turn-helix domain-containing protein [Pseudonocardia thermophila]SHK07881.1 Transcriptional regulator of acetoin/glycerol metabolism [Pseudonocardia thermophila]
MAELPDRQLMLASARAQLLEGATRIDCPGVPDLVVASWRRSVSRGVSPNELKSTYHPDLDVECRLVRCAKPVVEQLVEQIADVPACVVLTDDRARILVRRESSRWISRVFDRVYFAEGFGYAEDTVGTNGVGTVLEFGESVQIVGAEHFVDNLQTFACAGAPVRDPITGRIQGVLDISCLRDHSTPLMHSLVRTAAQSIERNLLHDRSQAQQALFDAYARVESRTREAVVAVGPRVVIANNAMQTLLVPGDQEALHDHIRFATQRHSTVDDAVELPSGARIRLRGSTVACGHDVAGMIGVVTLLSDQEAAPALPLPDPPRRERAESSSPAVRSAQATAARALEAGEPVLVIGEPGSGRCSLLADLATDRRPGLTVTRIEARTVQIEPREVARRLVAPARDTVHVLCDIDEIGDRAAQALVDAVSVQDGVPGLLGGTTSAAGGGDRQRLLTLFRQSVTVPPLRHRTADLPVLVRSILAELAPHRELRLSTDASRVLGRYRWPGNIRELHEVLATAVARRPVGVITAEDLPAYCQSVPRSALRQVDQVERDVIVEALRRAGGNRKAAAKALGLARSTLYRKIRQYGITD